MNQLMTSQNLTTLVMTEVTTLAKIDWQKRFFGKLPVLLFWYQVDTQPDRLSNIKIRILKYCALKFFFTTTMA